MDNGFVKLFRNDYKPFEKGVFDRFHAYAYLVQKANIATSTRCYKGQTITLFRGQLVTSTERLAEVFHWDESKTWRALRAFERQGLISCKAYGKAGTVITILHYDTEGQTEDITEGQTEDITEDINPLLFQDRRTSPEDITEGQTERSTGEIAEDTIRIKNEKIRNISSSGEPLYERLTDDEHDELFNHINEADHLAVSDRLLEIESTNIEHPFQYAMKVAKEMGVWRGS